MITIHVSSSFIISRPTWNYIELLRFLDLSLIRNRNWRSRVSGEVISLE